MHKKSLRCFFINIVFLVYFGELIFKEIDFVLIFLFTTTCDFFNLFWLICILMSISMTRLPSTRHMY